MLGNNNKIIFEPTGKMIDLVTDSTIYDGAIDQSIPIRSDCGGKGTCLKCRIVVSPNESFSQPSTIESKYFSPNQISSGRRLACQTRVIGSGTVSVPSESMETEEAIGKTGLTGEYPVHRQHDVTSLFSGWREHSLGIALDIGTTTLAGYLCDMHSGCILSSAGMTNPQRCYGEDVISRIAYSIRHDNGLEVLQNLVTESLNVLIDRILKKNGANIEDIDEVSIVGNTTMEYILAGLNPARLGIAPYLPTTYDLGEFSTSDLNLNLPPATNVYLSPIVSGFIGGDTIGAILAAEPHKGNETCLIIDMGTNGELVVGNNSGLWATSCATGPALEGSHLSCGMRASTGAICHLQIDPTSLKANYEVIGGRDDTPPSGICGSGIIDAIAEMRRVGLLDQNGRFIDNRTDMFIGEEGLDRRFVIVAGDESVSGKELAITQKDVQQVQLAKASIGVGIKFLMQASGFNRIDRLVLTGAFGARFTWPSAVTIGMLPKSVVKGTVEVMGNAAGVGAIKALLDSRIRDESLELTDKIQVVELASKLDFKLAFARATQLSSQDLDNVE